ncbi:hypothetical protein VIGAN_06019300 [Vigna angularis var. angularis]|uniref:Uncharacterized protein n=1 Tax=Vigna angularis var. angularis TaxID=157739 RepID=A0A0S3S8V9_PHAAN|nr:hypothetical protein VIGAN_06019300 [Vigna angularis var. angularis]
MAVKPAHPSTHEVHKTTTLHNSAMIKHVTVELHTPLGLVVSRPGGWSAWWCQETDHQTEWPTTRPTDHQNE